MIDKILVVDDDPDVREALKIILEQSGYQVITAQNGIEGLTSLKVDQPGLMILDLLMPKMDGFAVLKELEGPRWSGFKNIPIIILTAVREEASQRRYELETGVDLSVADYVEKPINPDILVEKVKRLIRSKQKRKRRA
jgi:two-component system alkaline phosphatase synthesis response regulator PhoP